MKKLLQQTWFQWAVIILTVVNLSMIAGFAYKAWIEEPRPVAQLPPKTPERGLGRMLREELQLNQEQHLKARDARKNFHTRASQIAKELQMTRHALLHEMQRQQPEHQLIKSYADSIGFYHGQLKHATADFYLELKRICTPKQQEQLRQVFSKLMRVNEMVPPKMHRRKGRPGKPKHKRNHQPH